MVSSDLSSSYRSNTSPPGPHPASTNKEISSEYRCNECDRPFPSEDTLERHKEEAHQEVDKDDPTTAREKALQ